MLFVIQVLANGLLLGGIYALISVGLNLIFGVMRVKNLAHGDFLMVGMYMCYFCFTIWGIQPYFAIPIVFATLFLLGMITHRFLIQPLLGGPNMQVNTIMVTAGLGLILQNIALMWWGADYRVVDAVFSGQSFDIFGLMLGINRSIAFFVVVIVAALMYFMLMKTKMGRMIRAVMQDYEAAILMGINEKKVYVFTFGLGIGLVGIAASILSPIYYTFPQVGLWFGVIAFITVVIGGLGSFAGAFIGGLLIGVVQAGAGVIVPSELARAFAFILFLLILFFKPEGLMGKIARV